MTVNLPGKMKGPVEGRVKELLYPSRNDYCVGLMLWDVYSKQPHATTGPLIRGPAWSVDARIDALFPPDSRGAFSRGVRPARFSVRVPEPIYPLALQRRDEEQYRSDSAYILSLIFFDFDPKVPLGKGVPHHKIVPLMQKPKWLREKVISQLAEDFGSPDRKWPDGMGGRIAEITSQMELEI